MRKFIRAKKETLEEILSFKKANDAATAAGSLTKEFKELLQISPQLQEGAPSK